MQHADSVVSSFSSNAEMFLASPVHSTGADLEWLSRTAAGMESPIVLDMGCGAGHASFALAPFSHEVIALDITESMLEVTAAAAKERNLKNLVVRQGSVESLPFDSARFDLIVSRYSAHHWLDVPCALAEARRVLKPGGQVCFIDLAGAPSPLLDTHLQAVELARDPSHVRSYTTHEWLTFFQQAGFEVHVEQEWRLAIDFPSWTARVGSSDVRVAAIKTIWAGAPKEVLDHFSLENDCSFRTSALMLMAKIGGV